jgi:hypothetical protein
LGSTERASPPTTTRWHPRGGEAGVNNANLVCSTFPNYDFYHKKTNHTTTKGGVALFIKQGTYTSLIERSDLSLNTPQIEDLWLQVNNTVIGVIYKHPKASVELLNSSLEANLETIVQERKLSMICGDLNINLLNVNDPEVKSYTNNLLAHNFIPTITLPTRITNNSLTLIDHINLFRPIELMRTNSASGNLFFDLSDHLPNFILLESSPPTQTTQHRPLIRIFSEQNIQNFQNTLTATNWTSVLEETNVTASYNEFIERLTNIFNQSFPLVKQSRQSVKNRRWITPAIKVSIEAFDKKKTII